MYTPCVTCEYVGRPCVEEPCNNCKPFAGAFNFEAREETHNMVGGETRDMSHEELCHNCEHKRTCQFETCRNRSAPPSVLCEIKAEQTLMLEIKNMLEEAVQHAIQEMENLIRENSGRSAYSKYRYQVQLLMKWEDFMKKEKEEGFTND